MSSPSETRLADAWLAEGWLVDAWIADGGHVDAWLADAWLAHVWLSAAFRDAFMLKRAFFYQFSSAIGLTTPSFVYKNCFRVCEDLGRSHVGSVAAITRRSGMS